jgi:hypothetical protein
MSKRRISEEGNPISSGIDATIVSPPSPKKKVQELIREKSKQYIIKTTFVWMTR